MTLRELTCAYVGWRSKDREEWERVRTLCYYQVVASQGNAKIKTPYDLFKHPWEIDNTPKRVGTRKVLSRDELAEAYKKSGIPMTDTQIDLMIEKRDLGRNR
jgi:hypothetical protein